MTDIIKLSDAIADNAARHIIPLSGGKDSAALAVYLTQRYPKRGFELIFTDTGAELRETYEYLEKLEAVLNIKINRLTALDVLGIRAKSDRTPFDYVLNEYYGGFLPNPQARWCTRLLKIRPFEKFVGSDRAYTYIAIRADENREGYKVAKKPIVLSEQQNIMPVYPFRDDGITFADVKEILEVSMIGLPKYYEWRSRSGCYFCFYQQIGEWQRLKERHPDLFEKSKSYEKVESGRKYTWQQGRSLEDIEKMIRKYEVPSLEEAEGCAICHL